MIRLRRNEYRKPTGPGDYYAVGEIEFLCPACGATNVVEEAPVNGSEIHVTFECDQCDVSLSVTASVTVDVEVEEVCGGDEEE